MAENNDALFTIDAGDVLARLHMSTCSQLGSLRTSSENDDNQFSYPINTGIANMVDNASKLEITDVKNAGVTFDLKNPSQQYEVGFIVHKFTFSGKNEFVTKFNDTKKEARDALFKYFSGFAGKFKAKNVEESEVYACLVNRGFTPFGVSSYKSTKYQISKHMFGVKDLFRYLVSTNVPYIEKIASSTSIIATIPKIAEKVDLSNQLCFKIAYHIDSETM